MVVVVGSGESDAPRRDALVTAATLSQVDRSVLKAVMRRAAETNGWLKGLESDALREEALLEIRSGICVECGSVSRRPCYCTADW